MTTPPHPAVARPRSPRGEEKNGRVTAAAVVVTAASAFAEGFEVNCAAGEFRPFSGKEKVDAQRRSDGARA